MINVKNIKVSSPIMRYALLIAVIWTFSIAGSIGLNIKRVSESTLEAARIQARAVIAKDMCYRRWNSMHGGVYVPITKKTQPSPYLKAQERNITTPSGTSLTLMNPAYMTRQVHELTKEEYGVIAHITSLNPIRPENAADKWETRALQAFERKELEVSSLEEMKTGQYMRLMRPFITEKGCLKCHETQGYKEGDIRGGISVTVPIQPLGDIEKKELLLIVLSNVVIWLLGLSVLLLGTRKLSASVIEKNIIEEEVNARKKAEEKFHISMLQWQATFDAANDAICLLGPDQRILQCNQAMTELMGKSREEMKGRFCWEIVHGTTEPIPECPVIRVRNSFNREEMELHLNGKWFHVTADPLTDETGTLQGIVHIIREITERKQIDSEREKLVSELKEALAKVKTLSGFLPICACCKKIRDDKGYWNKIETYIHDHSEAEFSHGICPECAKKLYPDYYQDK